MAKKNGFILTTLEAFARRSMRNAADKRGLGPRHPKSQEATKAASAHNAALLAFLNGDYALAVDVFKSIETEIEKLIKENDDLARMMSDAFSNADVPELPKNWRPDGDRVAALRELLGEFKDSRRRLERRMRDNKRRKHNS